MKKWANSPRILLAACLLLGLCGSRFPAHASAASVSAPQIKYEKYTLKNGLEVILSEDHRLPLVAVNLWYHVGPANERAGRTGFAHLFEHMMFEGSQHVGPKAHDHYLEGAGASDINGTTDFDRTNYFETLPSNQLELALWLESDRMGYLLGKLDRATPRQPARRRAQRTPPVGRELSVRAGRGRDVSPAVSERASLLRGRHGLARTISRRRASTTFANSSASTTRPTTPA